MADVTLTYKGSTIAEMSNSGTKTLKTSGKYCEGDIGVSYVKPSSGGSDELAKKIITGEGDITELPSGITKIKTGVFTASSNLKITYIPDGVTSIGGTSFQNCQNLITISIPNSVTSIGFWAFNSCLNLTTVIFKGTPTDIYSNAFSTCDKITNIYVPWAEGAVAGAPWGATNATIHYNTTT